MLNLFPQLLNYSLIGPFILRGTIGLVFLDLGILKFKSDQTKWLGGVKVIIGLMLIVGIYTQIATLVAIIMSSFEFKTLWQSGNMMKRDMVIYVLTLAITLSLLLTGAGTFSLDLPL